MGFGYNGFVEKGNREANSAESQKRFYIILQEVRKLSQEKRWLIKQLVVWAI